MKKNVLILLSDLDSINIEIIQKSLFFFKKDTKNNYIFIGCKKELSKKINLKKNHLNIINIKSHLNKKTYFNRTIKKAFKILKSKKAQALINLPLNKTNLPKKFNGFTEYIADYFKLKNHETMLLYNKKFSVSPNTTHIPLKLVSSKLSIKKIQKNIINIYNFYKTFIGIKNPIIGILGFNPHNGTDFKFTTEEDKIIKPAINSKKLKHITIYGPLSPDAGFNQIKTKELNCLIGNYHDQVLPTFKYIYKLNAINITLGLPFLRISPDHGTAKDIKNKGLAKPDSFLYALNFLEKYSKVI